MPALPVLLTFLTCHCLTPSSSCFPLLAPEGVATHPSPLALPGALLLWSPVLSFLGPAGLVLKPQERVFFLLMSNLCALHVLLLFLGILHDRVPGRNPTKVWARASSFSPFTSCHKGSSCQVWKDLRPAFLLFPVLFWTSTQKAEDWGDSHPHPTPRPIQETLLRTTGWHLLTTLPQNFPLSC